MQVAITLSRFYLCAITTHCSASAASTAGMGLMMYDLYDHITAEPFAPGLILITNFLCCLTNLERRTPSQYPHSTTVGICVSLQWVLWSHKWGWRQPALSKSVSRYVTRSEALQPYSAFFSFNYSQETALLSTAILHRPYPGLIVASAVVGHTGGRVSTQMSIMLR